jgi:hypothetical protein
LLPPVLRKFYTALIIYGKKAIPFQVWTAFRAAACWGSLNF